MSFFPKKFFCQKFNMMWHLEHKVIKTSWINLHAKMTSLDSLLLQKLMLMMILMQTWKKNLVEIIFQKMKNTYLLVILIPMQRLFLVSSLFMSKKNNDCDSAKMVKLLFWYFFKEKKVFKCLRVVYLSSYIKKLVSNSFLSLS